jgi:hypothetical protein
VGVGVGVGVTAGEDWAGVDDAVCELLELLAVEAELDEVALVAAFAGFFAVALSPGTAGAACRPAICGDWPDTDTDGASEPTVVGAGEDLVAMPIANAAANGTIAAAASSPTRLPPEASPLRAPDPNSLPTAALLSMAVAPLPNG